MDDFGGPKISPHQTQIPKKLLIPVVKNTSEISDTNRPAIGQDQVF